MSDIATSPAFERCHAVTKGWEGGWVNDANDRGGPTNFGVTQATYDGYRDRKHLSRQSVKLITMGEATEIFFTVFWLGVGADHLFAGVDLAAYDAGVNSGVSRARGWLIASLDPNDQHDRTVKNICGKRLSFVEGLSNFWKFGHGWTNRITDIQAKGVAWALAAMKTSPVAIERSLSAEASTKAAEVKTESTKGAASATTGGAGAVGSDQLAANLTPDQAQQAAGWILAGSIVLGAVLTAYFVWRAWVKHNEANSYRAVADRIAKGADA